MTKRRTRNLTASRMLVLTTLFFLFSSVIIPVTTVFADSRYVVPSAEVALRSGAGGRYKVIGVVKDGDQVDFLGQDGAYARVRLSNGKEGWMLARFLSNDPPLGTVVASLREENDRLKQKEQEFSEKFKEVSENLSATEANLQNTLNERNQIASDYKALEHDTANVIQIKEDKIKATQQNEALNKEISALREENARLKKDKSINWFLAGGAVLLVGMFLGRLFSASRKKKSSLL